MKLIREYVQDILCESTLDESTNVKQWSISGITLQSNLLNKNKRMYPKNVLSEAINNHIKNYMNDGRAVGELNHLDNGISAINLERVSHKFVSVTEDGDNFITKAEVLNTPTGKIVQNLLEGKVKLGISSRGLGNIKTIKEGGSLVENFHIISLGDIVSDPSANDAFVQGILEGTEYILSESGIISQKEILTKVDIYNKIIKDAKQEDINEAIRNILKDFTNLVSK